MEFEALSELVFSELRPKLEEHEGLSIFVRERAKFEGWLKVEVCDSLTKHFDDVTPENERIDITFQDWAIELKTINTNIKFEGVKSKTRPITKNTQAVIDDIKKLRLTGYRNRAVLFVVFPIWHSNENWQRQLNRISERLSRIDFIEFNFRRKIPGALYFGLVGQ